MANDKHRLEVPGTSADPVEPADKAQPQTGHQDRKDAHDDSSEKRTRSGRWHPEENQRT
jgi:hypothetical protein